MKADFSL
jgi:hypothetical protein